jgi:hypothetical protein
LLLARQLLEQVRTLATLATVASHDLAIAATLDVGSNDPMKQLLDAWAREDALRVPVPTEHGAIATLSHKLRRSSGTLSRWDAEKRLSGAFDELKQDRQVWFRDAMQSAVRGADRLQRQLEDAAKNASDARALHHIRCTKADEVAAMYLDGAKRMRMLRGVEWSVLRERATAAADQCSADYKRWTQAIVAAQVLAAGAAALWITTTHGAAGGQGPDSNDSSTWSSGGGEGGSDDDNDGMTKRYLYSALWMFGDAMRLVTILDSFGRWARFTVRVLGLVVVLVAMTALIAVDAWVVACLLAYGIGAMFFGHRVRLALTRCKGWLWALGAVLCAPFVCFVLVQRDVEARRVELLRAAGVGSRGVTSDTPAAGDCETIHVSPRLKRATVAVAFATITLSMGIGRAIGQALINDSAGAT